MAILDADGFSGNVRIVEERFHSELADRMPCNSSVGMAYLQQIPSIHVISEAPLSPLMARFKKAGLLGCFDNTGINSKNYKELLDE
jgi:hypothetical protein